MTEVQCRMALASLGWSWDRLATESGVSRPSVARFLTGGSVGPDLVAKLSHALTGAGVVFMMNGPHGGRGVVAPKAKPVADHSGGNPTLRR